MSVITFYVLSHVGALLLGMLLRHFGVGSSLPAPGLPGRPGTDPAVTPPTGPVKTLLNMLVSDPERVHLLGLRDRVKNVHESLLKGIDPLTVNPPPATPAAVVPVVPVPVAPSSAPAPVVEAPK